MLFDIKYRYNGSNRIKIILNWSKIKKCNLYFDIFLGYIIFWLVSLLINKAGIMLTIDMIIKYIWLLFLITRYDDSKLAR